MAVCAESTVILSSLAVMRLRLQEEEPVSSDDVEKVIDVISNCEFVDDSIFRHSLILLLETLCRRIWQVSESEQSHVEGGYRKLASVVIEKIGGSVERMQFRGELWTVVFWIGYSLISHDHNSLNIPV